MKNTALKELYNPKNIQQKNITYKKYKNYE